MTKRVFDVVFSALVLVLLSWLYLILALYVRIAAGAPILTKRECLTRNGKHFWQYKFRTMKPGKTIEDPAPWIPGGYFLMVSHLDELPQFWNVLVGDMALIGPRPLLPRYLPWYTEEEKQRHDVRPGITGYAQCHGRNTVAWDEKLAMDVWYANHVSLSTDLRIVFKTIKSVLKRESVEVAGVEALDTYRKRKGK